MILKEDDKGVFGSSDLDLLLPVVGGVVSGVWPGLDLLGDEAHDLPEGRAGAGDQAHTLSGARVEVVSLDSGVRGQNISS